MRLSCRRLHALLAITSILFLPPTEANQDPSTLESVVLERTPCFGRCPSYKVEVSRNGKVVFFGEKFVVAKGERTSQIKGSRFLKLEKDMRKVNFSRLRERYAEYSDGCKEIWTDHPSFRITAKYNVGQKEVAHYLGCKGIPILSDIEHLADAIDAVAGTSKWVGQQ